MAAGREPSEYPLSAGILSALLCLRARQSALTDTFQTISLAQEDIHA